MGPHAVQVEVLPAVVGVFEYCRDSNATVPRVYVHAVLDSLELVARCPLSYYMCVCVYI